MTTARENLSRDLIWEVTRNNNAFLVKRKTGGGVQFSRDPLNLTNRHSRKFEGYLNDKAVGIQAESNTVELTTKISKQANNPAQQYQHTSFKASTPTRKLYRSVVNTTVKSGYRPDLSREVVTRASAVRQSQRENKKEYPTKERGSKAKKAAAASS